MTRKMKDSGIEWIGEIPEDWEIVKLKHLALDRQAGVWGKDKSQDNLTNNKICIRIADFDYPRMTIRKDREFTLRNYTDNEISKCSLQKGDILIEKSGGGEKTPVGRTIIWNEDFQALYANFIERLRVDKKQIFPMFAQFCFFAFYGIGGSNLYFNQTTGIQNLNITGMLNDLRLPTPDLSTQIKIVGILDRKRNQIESIKSAIIKEIENLENYKKSVITEAVTKGLDKNVEMKDSGIDWIGEIPKHWEVKNIKNLTLKSERGTSPSYIEDDTKSKVVNQATFSQGFFDKSNIKYSKIPTNNSKGLLQKGDVLIASTGGGVLGKTHFFIEDGEYVADGHITILRTDSLEQNSKILYYIFSVNYELINGILAKGSTNQTELQSDWLKNFKVPYTSINEQNQIVDYLDKKTKLIDDSIAIKQKQLETLEEYKKSLIYEYVTGKKEVKDGEES